MASSCLPLGSSRHQKGVFLGTAGGALAAFTPTVHQVEWEGAAGRIDMQARNAQQPTSAACPPHSFPPAHASGHFPRACDSFHTLVSQDGHCRARQARHVALRGGCLRAGSGSFTPQVVMRRGSLRVSEQRACKQRRPNRLSFDPVNAQCSMPGVQRAKTPHPLQTEEREEPTPPHGIPPHLGRQAKGAVQVMCQPHAKGQQVSIVQFHLRGQSSGWRE